MIYEVVVNACYTLLRKLNGHSGLSLRTLIKRLYLLINSELLKMNAPLRRSARLASKRGRPSILKMNSPLRRSPRLADIRVKKYEQWFKSRMMDLPKSYRFPEQFQLLFSIMTSALNNLYRIRYNYEMRRDLREADFMIVKLYESHKMIREIIYLYGGYDFTKGMRMTDDEHKNLLKTHAKFSEVIRNRLFIVEDMVEFIVNNKIAGVTYLDFGRGNLNDNLDRISRKAYDIT